MARTQLLSVTLTAAVTATTTGTELVSLDNYRGVLLDAVFTYGSGGTSADAYVQTSADGGTTWYDIANFHFITSSVHAAFNLRATTVVTTQNTTYTNGSMTANTSLDGLLGDILRVKYVSVGTYAGGTTLVVTAIPR